MDVGPGQSYMDVTVGKLDNCTRGERPTMTKQIPEHFTREMGLSHREFMRTLPAAVSPLNFQLADKTISIDHPGGNVQICLQEMPDRCIGAIQIPKMSVEFRFSGLSHDERAQFIHRFDLHFQRGGG